MGQNQSKTRKILIWSISVVLVFVVVVILLSQVDFSSKIKGLEEATNNFFVQTLNSDALTPPPLRGVFGEQKEPLTEAGVLLWTNKNREDNAEIDLTQNSVLSKMAKQKLEDMFTNQYFEHESPSGVGPSDLAKQVGYDYIIIGENLALGNFDGDKALVDAWMASPGHRANILNVRYREIGIAVGQGVFEGKKTWVAVQEFGIPITACPQPSSVIKSAIDQAKKDVDKLEVSLTAQKKAIDEASPKYGADYEAMVSKYNASVHKFNALVTSLKDKIANYNKQVSLFNNCADLSSTTPKKI